MINDIGLWENTFFNEPFVFPNPTHGSCLLDLRQHYSKVKITVQDITGKSISYHKNLSGREFEILLPKTSGIYFLVIDVEGNRITRKVIKH